MPTGVGGNQAFTTERVTEGTSLPVGANLANSFIGVEIQGDTTPYKIDISSLSGRLNITQTILGVIKPKGKGAYSVATQYTLMDYVDSGNQHYLYIGDTPSTGTPLTDTTKWTPLLTDGVNGTNGTNGTNGVNAYTTTSAAFTAPAINSAVTISVVNSAWMVSGQTIFIATAGIYTIASIISATSISATNTGASGNAAAAATISSGSTVSPGGRNGTNGTSAIATTSSFTQPAINANVTVTVNSSAGFVDKQPLFHDLGGYYTVNGNPPSATTVSLKNLGYAGNIAASASVGVGILVPSGIKGLDGSGGGGAVGLKFTLNTTAGTPAASEIRSPNLAAGGTIAINPTDTQASASDILGRLGVGAIVDLRNSDSKWVRGTVTTAWTAGSGSFEIGSVRSAGAIGNAETVYLSIASDAPLAGPKGDKGDPGTVSATSGVIYTELSSAPSTPTAGNLITYAKTDHKLYKKDSTGAESAISEGAFGNGRVALTADRIYYVRSAGTRTGLLTLETDATTNVDSDAFGSLQVAITAMGGLDLSVYKATIQLQDGTYPRFYLVKTLGSLAPTIQGNSSNPDNVVLQGFDCDGILDAWTVKDCKIQQTASYNSVQLITSKIKFDNINWGTTNGVLINAEQNSIVNFISNFKMSGSGSDRGFIANGASLIYFADNSTVTRLNTPAFPGGFIYVASNSFARVVGVTFVGSRGGAGVTLGGTGGEAVTLNSTNL